MISPSRSFNLETLVW